MRGFRHPQAPATQSMACYVETSKLNEAASAIHRALIARKIDHAFSGGYELVHLGSKRETRNVEVLVKAPMFNGFEKVKQAFFDNSDFSVFNGRGTDGMAIIHKPTTVHVALTIQERLPRILDHLVISDGAKPPSLPFLPPSHLYIKIIQNMSTRSMDSDRRDLLFLKEKFPAQLDMVKVNKTVTDAQRNQAIKNLRKSSTTDEYERAIALLRDLSPVNAA